MASLLTTVPKLWPIKWKGLWGLPFLSTEPRNPSRYPPSQLEQGAPPIRREYNVWLVPSANPGVSLLDWLDQSTKITFSPPRLYKSAGTLARVIFVIMSVFVL